MMYDAGHMTTRPCSTETVSSPDYRVTTNDLMLQRDWN